MKNYPLLKIAAKEKQVALYRLKQLIAIIERVPKYLYLLHYKDELLITDHQMKQSEVDNFGKKAITINGMIDLDIECKWPQRNEMIEKVLKATQKNS